MKAYTRLRPYDMDEVEFEPSVDAANLGVIAKDGIVILTGKASSYVECYPAFEGGRGLKFCRGMLYASAISITFWLTVGGAVWWVTR